MGRIAVLNRFLAIIVVVSLALAPSQAYADALTGTERLPFKPGEKIIYDVSWLGIVAGEARLEVVSQINFNGHNVQKLKISSTSTGWVRKIHRVDDATYSYFDVDNLHSHKVEIKISEGSYRKTKIMEFNQEALTVKYTVNDKEPKEFDIDPDSQDPLSSIFYLRTMRDKIKVGARLYIPIFDDKKKYELEVRILHKERLNLPKGMVDTIVVRPFLKSEGVFQRKGKMWIWLTDDEYLIPVQIRSKIAVGSFYATMKDSEGAKITYLPYPKKEIEKKTVALAK
ncbi:hypothetical protein MNBD_NITROSPINAE01-852 [hydrothermal vent metagenome]|uniref:DUF3108 domain-containing protein n=1 Tax=hydrothermal vent metagenome TaxID=652676 RepID=A0A3B1CT14_9ZZZZ